MDLKFGERLSLLRKRLKLTQKEFGQKIGVSKTSVGNYETNVGLPDFNTIVSMLRNFDVRPDWLIMGKGDMFIEDDSISVVGLLKKLYPDIDGILLEKAIIVLKCLPFKVLMNYIEGGLLRFERDWNRSVQDYIEEQSKTGENSNTRAIK